jgi:UDP-glucose 4-epimerase
MHFASHTMVGESIEKPFLYLGDNVANARNLLEAMLANDCKKIILSSTANLFDQPERMPIGPDEKVIPGSPYGESKAIIERLLYWLHRTHGLRYACLRYFNAAGATDERGEDHTPETHLIPLVLQVALGQRDSIKMFGDDYDTPDGTCVRDYIHIADLAKAHLLALEALEEQPELHYNLGNGAGFSVKQVVDTARAITGHAIPAETVERRAGDPATLVADATKIREELGWQPDYPDLESIMQSAWNWHQKNPGGYA